jgi:hypothetical protein
VPRLILNLGATTGEWLLVKEGVLPFTAENTVGLSKPIFWDPSAIWKEKIQGNMCLPNYDLKFKREVCKLK